LSAWKESPLFTEEERAVLQLTEEVTLISDNGVCDETYNNALKIFGENILAQIIMQVIIINSWNRIAVSTRQIFEQII
jgi:alkylhydroperoxidase family enzyme